MKIIVTTTVTSTSAKAFNYILPIKLSSIVKTYKFLPGISRTNEQEIWNKKGYRGQFFLRMIPLPKSCLLMLN